MTYFRACCLQPEWMRLQWSWQAPKPSSLSALSRQWKMLKRFYIIQFALPNQTVTDAPCIVDTLFNIILTRWGSFWCQEAYQIHCLWKAPWFQGLGFIESNETFRQLHSDFQPSCGCSGSKQGRSGSKERKYENQVTEIRIRSEEIYEVIAQVGADGDSVQPLLFQEHNRELEELWWWRFWPKFRRCWFWGWLRSCQRDHQVPLLSNAQSMCLCHPRMQILIWALINTNLLLII